MGQKTEEEKTPPITLVQLVQAKGAPIIAEQGRSDYDSTREALAGPNCRLKSRRQLKLAIYDLDRNANLS
jgi:hypothetical protein